MKKNTRKNTSQDIFILGAGVTGLSAGYASGLPVYEAEEVVGGICTSYYMKPGSSKRLFNAPADGNAYPFEMGGGHWIFGGEREVKKLIAMLSPYKTYERKSSVYLPSQKRFVPYPLQNNLSFLDDTLAHKAFNEILNPPRRNIQTMKAWLEVNFGKTLSRLFFNPFHKLYTAGLYTRIAPQDSYKSPIHKEDILRGCEGNVRSVGYNTRFIYPQNGLDSLTRSLAKKCDINVGKKITKIDLQRKLVFFQDNSFVKFEKLISTLPLNKVIKMSDLKIGGKPFPSPSVLVVNIGAQKGNKCPDDHWVYVPKSQSGFHRVGFYSNVDPMFLPSKHRKKRDRVSIYVEKAYQEHTVLFPKEKNSVARQIIKELQDWGWIGEIDIFDPTWIETAYTWSWPNSAWRDEAIRVLEEHNVFQVGRYGRWVFQGIADSMKDGLEIGKKFSS